MKIVMTAALATALLTLAQAPAFAQDPAELGGPNTQDVVAALQQIGDEVTVDDVARVSAAQVEKGPFSDLRAIGAGLVIMGAAFGIGMLARAAVESMARQPETAGQIFNTAIISAALIEGVTFFALIIIILQTAY